MSDMQAWSDERLIEYYYEQRDDASIGILLGRHENRLWSFVKYRCRDAADAEDVYQDTWERLTTDRAVYHGTNDATFRTFLFGVALRIIGERYGRRELVLVKPADGDGEGDEQDPTASVADEAAGVEEQLETQERKVLVHAAVRQLPPKQREAITLQHFGNLSRAEIARAMGIGEESVKTHLTEAVKKLQHLLKKDVRHG